MENGNTLTGTIETMTDGKLTFKTDYAGIIDLLMKKVKLAEEGKLAVEPSPEKGATTVEIQKSACINPPPKVLPKWHGNVAAGGYLQSGNFDRAGASFSAEALRRTESDRIKLRYIFNYAEEDDEVTTRNHYGEVKYDTLSLKNFMDL